MPPACFCCTALSLLLSHWGVPCFVDVDECSANNGGCEHTCQNLPGSFQCGCDIGHKLDEDRRSCICKCLVPAASGWAVGPSSACCPSQQHTDWSSLALHLTSFSSLTELSCGSASAQPWRAFPDRTSAVSAWFTALAREVQGVVAQLHLQQLHSLQC